MYNPNDPSLFKSRVCGDYVKNSSDRVQFNEPLSGMNTSGTRKINALSDFRKQCASNSPEPTQVLKQSVDNMNKITAIVLDFLKQRSPLIRTTKPTTTKNSVQWSLQYNSPRIIDELTNHLNTHRVYGTSFSITQQDDVPAIGSGYDLHSILEIFPSATGTMELVDSRQSLLKWIVLGFVMTLLVLFMGINFYRCITTHEH